MGPQSEPSVSGSGWERTSKGVKCSFPRQRETKHSGLCEDEVLRSGLIRGPSGRPRKPGVRGRRCGDEGARARSRFHRQPTAAFCPFLAGQKGTPAPHKIKRIAAAMYGGPTYKNRPGGSGSRPYILSKGCGGHWDLSPHPPQCAHWGTFPSRGKLSGRASPAPTACREKAGGRYPPPRKQRIALPQLLIPHS